MSSPPAAERVIDTLRANEPELRPAGIRHVCLFGSLARGEATGSSDIDLVVELDPQAIEQPRIRASVERDRLRAF